MSINQPPTVAQPHERGFFFDLLSLFKRVEHPAAAVDLFGEGDILDASGNSEHILDLLTLGADRSKRTMVYDEMDSFGLVSSILDLYAEETTQPDYDKQKRVWIESKAQHIVTQAEIGLTNCQVEDRITGLVRRIAKYGDEFRRLVYEAGKGVLGWKTVPAASVMRIEDQLSRLVGFKEDQRKYRQAKRDVSWPWDYVHFRLPGKDTEEVYGTSMLEAMFRPWRQLALTEDAMLMFRLRRTPDRNAIFVGVGQMDPTESSGALNAYRKKFRKQEFVDPASGTYKKQYNPLTPLEDVFLAVRSADDVRIEPLSGAGNIGDVYDLEYFRDAFFGSARVPKAYMGFEGDINAKATLLTQDVRFARGCKKLRSSAILGLRSMIDIHLILSEGAPQGKSFDPTLAENTYVVQMSPISYLDEFERLELVKLRFDIVEAQMRIASELQLDTQTWAAYILLNYAKLPSDLVLRLMTRVSEQPPDQSAVEASFTPAQRRVWDMLDQKTKSSIVNPGRFLGFSSIPLVEDLKCAKLVHESPALRKVIGDLSWFFSVPDLSESKQQTDLSLCPPRDASGKPIILVSGESDDMAKQLREDLEQLKIGKPLLEIKS